MAISVFDLFKVGIGPSSSHTVGPMKAAGMFARGLREDGLLPRVRTVRVALYGSLGLTGPGHGSDKAVLLGLEGEEPATVDVDAVPGRLAAIARSGTLRLLGEHEIAFTVGKHLEFNRRKKLGYHPNGMRFTAFDDEGAVIRERAYYSIGGGFVTDETGAGPAGVSGTAPGRKEPDLPYPFHTAAEMLAQTRASGLPVSGIMLENEKALGRTAEQIRSGLAELWRVMQACVERGCATEGLLPGGLKVPRRAPRLFRQLTCEPYSDDPLRAMDWVTMYALAVNEENAAGGRVVTAPTNGAAGIIPAVLHYYDRFVPGASEAGVARFLLTAAAIGALFKENASISGAEVGCQGEVGSACSMAAGALAEVLGGTPEQVENAAEIGIEHNLGLTCDPVGGLVQVPCIERNAVASITAINAARIALRGDGRHFISLDKAINTMRVTGHDMLDKYKETSRGGLAVNVIECLFVGLEASLELIGLSRRFGEVTALDGLSFSVPPGQVFGFLGPNGAGKTTAMRAIFGLVSLEAGEVRWQGEPVTEEARHRFGYMPEERGLYPSMQILDQLEYLGRLHEMTAAAARRAARNWISRLGLAGRESSRLEALSHGNQQRVQLAAALVHDPVLLVLDEPFAGLDPGGVDDMTTILTERARAGVTVLFSSHQLDLVEHICESVAIIHRGRVVAEGPVADLERGERPRLAVRVAGDPAGDWAGRLGAEVASVEQVNAGTVLLALAPGADSQRVLDAARAAGAVEHFSSASRRLSEVFRDVTGEDVDNQEVPR